MNRLVFLVILASVFLAQIASSQEIDMQRPKSFIVNGTVSEANRYPWYVSLRIKEEDSFAHSCGASLLSDRLVLTAAHCVRYVLNLNQTRPALPDDFEELGLNFTSFPNSFVFVDEEFDRYAFAGAQGYNVTGIEPNKIEMWFLHPQWFWQGEINYADIAVGLLAEPIQDSPKTRILSSSSDVYQTLNPSQPLHVIGLGNYYSGAYAQILQLLNLTEGNVNNDTSKQLQEVEVGSTLPRTLCGKLYTSLRQEPANDGSGNLKFDDAYPLVVPESQICVTPASDEQTIGLIESIQQELIQGTVLAGLGEGNNVSDSEAYETVSPYFKYIASNSGTCQGDSGGPLFLKGNNYQSDLQIGIVSHGIGCGSPTGDVYTNVQAFLQSDNSGFDSFLLDVLDRFPDQKSSVNMISSVPTPVSTTG